ncbi:SMI1/KNR4 family protein [Nocardia sp. CC201C]|uniref:SMI1/KNR4 family protein n=1 Tax=unclassified Nocardia TaxID=2637762 RepID=UPI0024A9A82E|nr:SMI1/KNR4 family protein [Nocardia sp. CC201C]
MELRDLVARAVRIGATPGLPASPAELAAAESRLGVRFDHQYRELMSICSGIEAIGGSFLYPADELGASPRWLERTDFLEIEYFTGDPPGFEMRNWEMIEPIFHPPPAGRIHVLIGDDELQPEALVCNFSSTDPDAPPGDIAQCRYEPHIRGDLTETLTELIDVAEELGMDDGRVESDQHDRADVYFQIGRLLRGISTQNRAYIRHALSARWRHEFDQRPGQPGLNDLRDSVCWHRVPAKIEPIEYDLWGSPPHSVRATATIPEGWSKSPLEAVIGVVKENTVWRIDSWSWNRPDG